MDNAVFAAAEAVANDEFEGGIYSGTLENEGVGIAEPHEDVATEELLEELDAIAEMIIAGDIETHPMMEMEEEESSD